MKITLAAMAVTVGAILAVLGGFGANRGSSVPILSAAAIPRPSAPMTLVDNPQEETRMRQRAARRSDEVTRLLALPSGPVFALGSEAGDTADTPAALMAPPALRPVVERPVAADLQLIPPPTQAAGRAEPDSGVAALPEGPLTPIAPDAYVRALRAATAKPNAQLVGITLLPPAEADTQTTPSTLSAQREHPDAKVAGLVTAPPLRDAAPPQPRAKPATLTARASATQLAKAQQAASERVKAEKAKAENAKAERVKAEKVKRASRAAANRKKLLARRARAAAAAKSAPVQTDWLGLPVRTGSR